MQLQPREQFTVVRQIEDHTDNSTYYVRAVIRNAKTDALISINGNDYLNLTDRGDRRFSASWQVPADSSGQGFYVSILTTVYTDSSYTTKSEIYGEKMDTYLVQDRFNQNLGGVGGGPDIDYKKIKKLLKEVIDEMEPIEPKVVTIEKPVIKEVKIPQIVKVEAPLDTKPLYEAMEKLTKENFSSTEKAGSERNKALLDAVVAIITELKGAFKKTDNTKEVVAQIKKELGAFAKSKDIEGALSGLTLSVKPKELKEEAKPVETTGSSVDPRVAKFLKK